MINLYERMLPNRQGSNPQPPDGHSDAHQTEPPRPAVEGLALLVKLLTDDNLKLFFLKQDLTFHANCI